MFYLLQLEAFGFPVTMATFLLYYRFVALNDPNWKPTTDLKVASYYKYVAHRHHRDGWLNWIKIE